MPNGIGDLRFRRSPAWAVIHGNDAQDTLAALGSRGCATAADCHRRRGCAQTHLHADLPQPRRQRNGASAVPASHARQMHRLSDQQGVQRYRRSAGTGVALCTGAAINWTTCAPGPPQAEKGGAGRGSSRTAGAGGVAECARREQHDGLARRSRIPWRVAGACGQECSGHWQRASSAAIGRGTRHQGQPGGHACAACVPSSAVRKRPFRKEPSRGGMTRGLVGRHGLLGEGGKRARRPRDA